MQLAKRGPYRTLFLRFSLLDRCDISSSEQECQLATQSCCEWPLWSASLARMNSEAVEYIKKPAEEFIRESWRLVKRCTKPDRQGAR